jgi:hypothetical protein
MCLDADQKSGAGKCTSKPASIGKIMRCLVARGPFSTARRVDDAAPRDGRFATREKSSA